MFFNSNFRFNLILQFAFFIHKKQHKQKRKTFFNDISQVAIFKHANYNARIVDSTFSEIKGPHLPLTENTL